jgi:trehalose 6-phosphate phosphatase
LALPPARLSGWLRFPRRSGVLTDFDGTIAPIVDDPASATLLGGIDAILTRLAARYAVTAVISGRPVAYLLERVGPIPGLLLIGLYGLEQARDGVVEELPEAGAWRAVVDDVAGAADAAAPEGVGVERKGLSVTLHVRTMPGWAGWVERWAAEQAERTGLTAHPGKMSVELRPPLATDKGTVVSQLAAGLDRVCFAGDDRGDLPAFAALAALAGTGVETLAVAVGSDETPPELLAAADAVVDGPEGARALLAALAAG